MPGQAVLLAESLRDAGVVDEIERLAKRRGIPVKRVSRQSLDARSVRGAHQGVAFEAEEYRFARLGDVLASVASRDRCLLIALDHVTDPGNLGAVVRSAEVAGASAVVVPKRRTAAVGPAAYKTSAGALSWLPVVQDNLAQAIEMCKQAGFWVAGADGSAPDTLWEAPLDGRLMLVLGSEGEGLSRLVRERCDYLVRLPVAGRVDSLNVAQAATVLAYEWIRRGEADRA